MTTTRYISWEKKRPGEWIGRANGRAIVAIDQYLSGGHRRAVLYLLYPNGKQTKMEGVYQSITHAKDYANELARLLNGEGSVI